VRGRAGRHLGAARTGTAGRLAARGRTRRGPAAPAPAAGPKAADPKAAGKPGQPANSTSTPSRFEPTEKVRADFDVSFPIDI
jgi:hypothetical protein